MISDSISFARAHEQYLTPPEYPNSRIQVEGCFEYSSFEELGDHNSGNIEDISLIDVSYDPDEGILRIWVSGWMDCEQDGEYDKSDLGDLQSVEVVDTENVDFGPDPDEEWDSRDMWD